MRLLFAGPGWLGSNARSFREGLARLSGVTVDEIDPDPYFIAGRTLGMRLLYRLTRGRMMRAYSEDLIGRARAFAPDAVVIFKGAELPATAVREISRGVAPAINIFPDKSPFQYGEPLASAIAEYDLVISTKRFHPGLWNARYGLAAPCRFVPHGYDPGLHFRAEPAATQTHDLVMIATWRSEYDDLLRALRDRLSGTTVSFAIGGHGWDRLAGELPSEWEIIGPQTGQCYTDWLRRGRIAIAPVETRLAVGGQPEPGDEVTSRTFELAGMHSFFLHRRTSEALETYDEATEVPMFDDAAELADKIRHFLAHPEARAAMAAAAHARAVPAYSHDSRAREVFGHIESFLGTRGRARG